MFLLKILKDMGFVRRRIYLSWSRSFLNRDLLLQHLKSYLKIMLESMRQEMKFTWFVSFHSICCCLHIHKQHYVLIFATHCGTSKSFTPQVSYVFLVWSKKVKRKYARSIHPQHKCIDEIVVTCKIAKRELVHSYYLLTD